LTFSSFETGDQQDAQKKLGIDRRTAVSLFTTTSFGEGGRILSMRPRGIIASTLAMVILNLSGIVGLQWSDRGEVVAALFFILCGYIVLWYYWRGKNWARILVLITSALAIFNVSKILRPYGSAVLYNSFIVVEAALGVFLLYWLNTKDVRHWFMRRRTDAPLEQRP
jgi:hypothetical protein